ncbi:hypothetical protein Cgig2_005808 [Carnegiea gigantea]|uniref:Uncharacterized protein n=1 Tax=Carnegiea gigantea TaxID=171969 RepID=A0A9Q1KIZ3_9CARY|nr:hypothetical protein Cgig2_005808 [Carnegiea gigantea]
MLDVVGIVLFLEPNRTVSKRDGSGDVDVRELVIFDDRAIDNVHLLNSIRTRVCKARLSKIHPKLLKVIELNSKQEHDHFLHEIGVELVKKAFYVEVAPCPGLQLLLRITERLNLPPPVYNRDILSQNTYYVLLRGNTSTTKADSLQGDDKETILDSQKDATLKAIRFLFKNYNVEICDVNFEQFMMYRKCSTFYQDEAIALEDEPGEKHLARQDKLSDPIACHSKLWSWISLISLQTSPLDWAYQWKKLILC